MVLVLELLYETKNIRFLKLSHQLNKFCNLKLRLGLGPMFTYYNHKLFDEENLTVSGPQIQTHKI